MKSRFVQLESGTYQVCELTMRQLLPIIEGGNDSRLVHEVIKVAVIGPDGMLLGDKALDMAVSEYRQIQTAVLDLHNFGGDEKKD